MIYDFSIMFYKPAVILLGHLNPDVLSITIKYVMKIHFNWEV